MKRLIPLVFLVLPMALFAQSPRDQETAMLKRFGLNDSQIAQVLDIQTKTRATIRQDAVQLRLLHAQMEKALLPANPNMQDVNGDITQITQTHADLMKTFVAARVQLRQIIGEDNFPAYSRFIRQGFGQWHHEFLRMRRPGSGGMMNGYGPMMDGSGSMMAVPFDDDGTDGPEQ
ncbi:MAG: hypothetical protein ABSG38_12920 [Spirochaetia bacterium]